MSRNPPESHKLWSELIATNSIRKFCAKNHIDCEMIGNLSNTQNQTKLKSVAKKFSGVLNDWNTCSTFLVFGLTILHMNMNGLRVLLRTIIITAIRLHKLCSNNPDLIRIYFPENQIENEIENQNHNQNPKQILYSVDEILTHLKVCLHQPYTYIKESEHLILKQHGDYTRFQYSHIMRFIQCDSCGLRPFKNNPIEKLLYLLLLTWLEIIRPWNICIENQFNSYISQYLIDNNSYQIYLEHFKIIYIHLWGPTNYTRYYMSLSETGPFFLLLAYRLKRTAGALFGEHVVEALNNSVKLYFFKIHCSVSHKSNFKRVFYN